jgi:hypothetical protein
MSMNDYLAEVYGSAGQEDGAGEDLEKQAQVELFAKLAAAEGINLNELSDGQVNELFEATMGKEAEEDEEEEKKEDAKKELAEKKEASDKLAEADYAGRVMAHAFTQELGFIEKEAVSLTEVGMRARDFAGKLPDKAKALAGKARDVLSGKQMREGLRGRKAVDSKAGKAMLKDMSSVPNKSGMSDAAYKKMLSERAAKAGKSYKSEASKKALKGAAKTVGAYGGLGLGAYGASKAASAIDDLALEGSVIKAAEAGWDVDEAAERVTAISILGLDESEKIAAAQDVEEAVETRSLEILEAAGYPVTWEE